MIPLRPQEFLKHVLSDTLLNDRFYYYAFKARRIKYCLKCIEQNIRDFGFGVLCCKWNHVECCNTHKTPLNFIPKYSRSNSVKALESILKGENQSEYHQYRSVTSFTSFESDYDGEKKKQLYFAPCLKNGYVNFLDKNLSKLPLNIINEYIGNPYVYLDFFYEYNRLKLSDIQLQEVFYSLLKLDDGILRSFWEDKVAQMEFYAGAVNLKSLRIKVQKMSGESCTSCNLTDCPAHNSS